MYKFSFSVSCNFPSAEEIWVKKQLILTIFIYLKTINGSWTVGQSTLGNRSFPGTFYWVLSCFFTWLLYSYLWNFITGNIYCLKRSELFDARNVSSSFSIGTIPGFFPREKWWEVLWCGSSVIYSFPKRCFYILHSLCWSVLTIPLMWKIMAVCYFALISSVVSLKTKDRQQIIEAITPQLLPHDMKNICVHLQYNLHSCKINRFSEFSP